MDSERHAAMIRGAQDGDRRARRGRAGVVAAAALLVGGGTAGAMAALSSDEEEGAVRARSAPEPSAVAPGPPEPPAFVSPSAAPSVPPGPRKASASPRPVPAGDSARPAPPGPSRTAEPAARAASSVAQRIAELVNAERARRGCGPVRHDDVLRTAARRHAVDMDARNYFGHTNPDGAGPGERINAAGYEWRTYGENLARGPETPGEVMEAWMDSPEHRAIILDCAFQEMGVGVHDGAGGPWWTQVFATSG
ncbi:CAP domain-containing protein [Streptomyces sp. NPDC051207]|uniref:CAP domain-containing protein n=1 Tax=Streptomyces sp. NPDC051207 TaxID=3154641 RepID=UPI003435FBED